MKTVVGSDGSRSVLVCVDCATAANDGADRVTDAHTPLWRDMWERACELNAHAVLSPRCLMSHHYENGQHVHHPAHSFWSCDWCSSPIHGRRFCASVFYLTQ